MINIFDQLNREVRLNKPPERIVSLVPSQTELLVDLGLGHKLVGVTKFCVHPGDLRKEKEVVGGTKQVHLDRISRLRPDVILCNKEENTREMVVELEKLAPVHVSDIKTIADSMHLIQQYGEIFEFREKAVKLTNDISVIKRDFQKEIAGFPIRKVAYLIWKDPWMVVGKNTFIDHLLQLNRLENVFSQEDTRYPEIALEDLTTKQPDLVLLSTEPFPFAEKHKQLLKKVVSMDRVHIVDGEYFSWYGSRLVAAFPYFKKLHAQFS